MRISRARPGRRPSEIGTRWPGRADVAWDWNLLDLVGLGLVIVKISPAWPGAGWARRRRLGPARPHLRELAPPAKTVGFEILDFLEIENITKRDIKRDISAIFVRNGMSRIVILSFSNVANRDVIFLR